MKNCLVLKSIVNSILAIILKPLLKKISNKVHVLARITPYMYVSKRQLLMTHFWRLNSATVYLCGCAIVVWWINKINRLHERFLRIIYNDKASSFENFVSKRLIGHHTRKKFASSWQYLRHIRTCRQNYHFANPSKNYVYHGSESISSLGPRIWNLVSDSLKEFDSISSFKKIINRYKMAARNLSVQAM